MERAPQGSSQGVSEAGESVGPALEPSPSLSAWISDASGPRTLTRTSSPRPARLRWRGTRRPSHRWRSTGAGRGF